MDRVIQRINYYPVDSAFGFGITYPLDSELSREKRYSTFEQPGLGGGGTLVISRRGCAAGTLYQSLIPPILE